MSISKHIQLRHIQLRVANWMMETFTEAIVEDTAERNHRFLEESLELVQSNGCTQAEAHMLVDYVYGRPIGELQVEAGDVLITLAALCNAAHIDLKKSFDVRMENCWKNIKRIREKQLNKPPSSPLPGSAS